MADSERIQVILPRDTASRLRKVVPSRSRRAFVAQAVERQLLIERQKAITDPAIVRWD